jgi:hypothetical protein
VRELPPLPTDHQDGSDWIHELGHGWRAVPAWGRDGWDLLEWPYAAAAHFDGEELHGLAVYEEGDVTLGSFPSRAERDAATDRIAAGYWRRNERGPRDLPEGEDDELGAHHRGAFSTARWEREAGA